MAEMKTGFAGHVCKFQPRHQKLQRRANLFQYLSRNPVKKINVSNNFLIHILAETRLHCRRIDGEGEVTDPFFIGESQKCYDVG